jgi:hypothetical protein
MATNRIVGVLQGRPALQAVSCGGEAPRDRAPCRERLDKRTYIVRASKKAVKAARG